VIVSEESGRDHVLIALSSFVLHFPVLHKHCLFYYYIIIKINFHFLIFYRPVYVLITGISKLLKAERHVTLKMGSHVPNHNKVRDGFIGPS
jgi:hypothetical protein